MFKKFLAIGIVVISIVSWVTVDSVLSAQLTLPSSAEPSGSECPDLDVIFIIDQSSSMSLPPANDPTNQRVEAVKGMIDLLVDLSIDQCRHAYHRVGVISFGTSTRVDLPLKDIHPMTEEEARILRERLKEPLAPDNLGQTYPNEAFRKAAEMLENAPRLTGRTRKRVILFITDGYPCFNGSCDVTPEGLKSLINFIDLNFDFSPSLKAREDCLRPLYQLYGLEDLPSDQATVCIERYPVSDADYAQSTYIFPILLRNDSPTSKVIDELLENFPKEYGGELMRLTQNRRDIPTTLHQILLRLAGVRPNLLGCGSFAVNPYLRKIRITAYKNSPDIQIVISYTDAHNLQHSIQGGGPAEGFTLDTDAGYYVFGSNERYSILNPYPGIWTIESSNCENIDIFYEEVQVRPLESPLFNRLPVYERPPYYDQDDPHYIELLLKDTSGMVISQPEDEFFALQVEAQVTLPNGEKHSYSLRWKPDTQRFVAEEPLLTPVVGTYRVHIVGTSVRHEGEPMLRGDLSKTTVFNKSFKLFELESDFNVVQVIPITIQGVDPKKGSMVKTPIHYDIRRGWPLKIRPLLVVVKLTDEQGSPLKVSDVFDDGAQALRAYIKQLVPQTGEEQKTPEIWLKPDPRDPTQLLGEFRDATFIGDQALVVEINVQNIKEGYWAYEPRIEIPFSRNDCLFCRSITYYVLFAIGLITFSTVVGYNIAIRTNKVSGTLVFVDGPTRIAEFSLYNGKNFRIISKKELSPYPQLELKRIRVQNLSRHRRGARSTEREDTLPLDASDVDEAGVRVDGVTVDGRRFSISLPPNTPTSYSSDTVVQMIYEPIQ